MSDERTPFLTPSSGVPRRTLLVEELTSRLRPMCADWPDDLFTAMVERLADITLKYEGQPALGAYDRRSTDRLIDDLKAALARNDLAREAEDASS